MPGKRSAGQKFIGCWIDQPFREKLDQALGGKSYSQFVRDSIEESLAAMGIETEGLMTVSPSRRGKGGPRRTAVAEETSIALAEDRSFPPAPAIAPQKVNYGKGKAWP